ncbi:MAG: AbrB family transcriptional regulator [Xanthobacteraceae bacterium]|jgi:putative addiction module antidote
MASKIQKLGDKRVVALPPDLLAQLGWDVGDVLTAEIFEDGIKFTRTNTKHDRALQIARKAMDKYRAVFEALAKS